MQNTKRPSLQAWKAPPSLMNKKLLGGMLYFMAIRPQKKEKQRQQQLLNSVAVGDTILTSSGFYGVIIDMTDDTVIVEFGSNKNCRIPMQKAAIVQVEKAEA